MIDYTVRVHSMCVWVCNHFCPIRTCGQSLCKQQRANSAVYAEQRKKYREKYVPHFVHWCIFCQTTFSAKHRHTMHMNVLCTAVLAHKRTTLSTCTQTHSRATESIEHLNFKQTNVCLYRPFVDVVVVLATIQSYGSSTVCAVRVILMK